MRDEERVALRLTHERVGPARALQRVAELPGVRREERFEPAQPLFHLRRRAPGGRLLEQERRELREEPRRLAAQERVERGEERIDAAIARKA